MANDITLRQRLWRWSLRRAKRLAGFAALFLAFVGCVIAYQSREDNKGPTNISCFFKPITTSKGIVVEAFLKNDDSINADKLRIKSKYEGTIFDVIVKPQFDNIVHNKWEHSALYIELDRLTTKNSCSIFIMGNNELKFSDKIKIAWGNGRYVVTDITMPTNTEAKLITSVNNATTMLNTSMDIYLKNNQTTLKSSKR